MRAISSFRRDVGIVVVACSALLALRMRESMSATGSVSISPRLRREANGQTPPVENAQHFSRLSPGALGHAGDDALVRELAQADPAEAELAEHRARAAAAVAARVVAHAVALRSGLLRDQRLLSQLLSFRPARRTGARAR